MEPLRIQKWISQLGIASRREVERWIKEGRIKIDGQVVTELGTKIDPETQHLAINGQAIERAVPPKVYWLLHKPDQYLTSHKSNDDKPTIFDLPRLSNLTFQLKSAGRLDYRTEGLLLLSNDGELIHRLTHPSFKVPRHYYALITGKLTPEQEEKMRTGIELEDGPARGIRLQYAHGKNLGKSRGSWYIVTVFEGRNRLVRRLFEHFDEKVVRLIRFGFGDLRLPDDLAPGDYRQLSADEIHVLKKATDLA